MRCSREGSTSFQLSVISILPCHSPDPAVKVFIADSELQAQINVTISETTNAMPFLNSSLGSLNIRMEVNSAMTSIGLGVRQCLITEILNQKCSMMGPHIAHQGWLLNLKYPAYSVDACLGFIGHILLPLQQIPLDRTICPGCKSGTSKEECVLNIVKAICLMVLIFNSM